MVYYSALVGELIEVGKISSGRERIDCGQFFSSWQTVDTDLEDTSGKSASRGEDLM